MSFFFSIGSTCCISETGSSAKDTDRAIRRVDLRVLFRLNLLQRDDRVVAMVDDSESSEETLVMEGRCGIVRMGFLVEGWIGMLLICFDLTWWGCVVRTGTIGFCAICGNSFPKEIDLFGVSRKLYNERDCLTDPFSRSNHWVRVRV